VPSMQRLALRRPTSRRAARATAAAAITVSAALALTGCGQGFDAGTTLQRPSGNGANTNAGPLQIRDVTIVKGSVANTGTVLLTVVNRGLEDDALVGVRLVDPTGRTQIGGTGAVGGKLPVPAQASTRIGFNSEEHVDIVGLDVAPTQYVALELQFEKAGNVPLDVMAVLPQGIYEGLGPIATTF